MCGLDQAHTDPIVLEGGGGGGGGGDVRNVKKNFEDFFFKFLHRAL